MSTDLGAAGHPLFEADRELIADRGIPLLAGYGPHDALGTR
ncbi:hypothetical protein [Blastococcus sp. SYSU DS0828]